MSVCGLLLCVCAVGVAPRRPTNALEPSDYHVPMGGMATRPPRSLINESSWLELRQAQSDLISVLTCACTSGLLHLTEWILYVCWALYADPHTYAGLATVLTCITSFVLYLLWRQREWRRLKSRALKMHTMCGDHLRNAVCGDAQGGCLYCAGVSQVSREHFAEEFCNDVIVVECFSNCCANCYCSGKPLRMRVLMDGSWFYVAYSQIKEAVGKNKETIMTNTKFSKSNRITSLGVNSFLQSKLQYAWMSIAAMAMDVELCTGEDLSRRSDAGTILSNSDEGEAGVVETEKKTKKYKEERVPTLICKLPEKARQNVISVPDGYKIIGYMTEGSTTKLRSDVGFEWSEIDKCDLNQVRKDAFIQEYHGLREGVGVNEAEQFILKSRKPAQAIVIGPYCKDTYVASRHSNCLLDALSKRHYTQDEEEYKGISERKRKLLSLYTQKILDYVCATARELEKCKDEHCDEDGKPVHYKPFNMVNGDVEPMLMCAKKWSEARKLRACEFVAHLTGKASSEKDKAKKAHIQKEAKILNGLTGEELERNQEYRRTVFVKLNEALGKMKPRMIVSGGDDASMAHTLDCFSAEALIFAAAFFESRSVKHANAEGLRDRFAKRLEAFYWAMSNDYGRFDSTLRAILREIVENKFLRGMLDKLGLFADCPVLRAALRDRLKSTLILNAPFWRAIVGDPGRESGDRGTSVLNYLTGIIVFCVLMHEEICTRCVHYNGRLMWSNATADQSEDYAESILEAWFKGEDVGFDFFGEGDDSLPVFTKRFVGQVDGFSMKLADRFVAHAKEMGLILEPQYVGGAAPPGEGMYPIWGAKGRVEFTSKIIKLYTPDKTVTKALLMPKIGKFLMSSSISFCTQGDVQLIAMTKMLSLMQNVLDVPILFKYVSVLFNYHNLKYKLRNRKVADGLNFEDLTHMLGSFDAHRLTSDLTWNHYAKHQSYTNMYADLVFMHHEQVVRGGESMHEAIAAAITIECPDFTTELQLIAVDHMTALIDQMPKNFERVYCAAVKEYGMYVTQAQLDMHIGYYYEDMCAELNMVFRGYFCEIFWGNEPPAATMAGA